MFAIYNGKQIKSTFPKKVMKYEEITKYLENEDELIILSSYVDCSFSDMIKLNVERFWTEDNKNEYGGNYNEYWRVTKWII